MLHGQSRFLNRPSKTKSATVLERGILQIERTGLSVEREEEYIIPGIMLRYGIGWGIELRFANNYEKVKNSHDSYEGLSDMEIGTEIQLYKSKNRRTEVAIMSHLLLPTGGAEISNERVGSESFLLVWHELNEKTGIEYNLGYSNFEDDSQTGDFIYSLAFEYELSDRAGIFIESYGELIELNTLEVSFDTGLSYQISDYFELDIAFGKGINHKMNFASLGVSMRLGEEE